MKAFLKIWFRGSTFFCLTIISLLGACGGAKNSSSATEQKTLTAKYSNVTQDIVSGGIYTVINSYSARALDVADGKTNDGANVHVWTRYDIPSQYWKVDVNSNGTYTLTNQNSRKVLDVSGAQTADGTNVQIWTSYGNGAQQWEFNANGDGTYTLINPNSGKALNVEGGQPADGANVGILTSNGAARQKWQFVLVQAPPATDVAASSTPGIVPGEIYTLTNSYSARALDVADGKTNDGANVHVWTRYDIPSQYWKIDINNNGTYTLTNQNSTKVLDVAGAQTADGTNVQIWSNNGSGAQQWKFNRNGDGTYTLINENSGKALNVEGVLPADGANVDISTSNGAARQKWQLVKVQASTLANWRLVWSDEFNGTSIDTSKWSFEENALGGYNNESQYYTSRPENARVENGHLVIEARKERFTGPDGTRDYTSARLRTLNKGDWLYGRIEARIKLPYGQGLWPAFWMLPTDNKYGKWAASGEIDILEAVNSNAAGGNTMYGSLHYGGVDPNNVFTTIGYTPASSIVDNYHTYAVEWEPTEVRWYIDNVRHSVQNKWWSAGGPFPAPFDQRFHVLLNVAVGGNWPGNPDASTTFPQRMEVDYVRVYQK